MPVTRLSQGLAFDPAAIQVMTAAYDSACRSLGLKGHADPLNEIVAKKIIIIAQEGERDPAKIYARVIKELDDSGGATIATDPTYPP